MDIFILKLVSNQLTIPVKIDRRQQQEETSENRGSMYTRVGHARPVSSRKNAKLGGVVLFVDTHPSTNIQSVNRICEN